MHPSRHDTQARIQELFSRLGAAGVSTIHELVRALEDGELLARLGIGDDYQVAIEELHEYYSLLLTPLEN